MGTILYNIHIIPHIGTYVPSNKLLKYKSPNKNPSKCVRICYKLLQK